MFVIKFDIQKFDDIINFNRWQIKMNVILTQSGLKKALLERKKSLKTRRKKLDRNWVRKS